MANHKLPGFPQKVGLYDPQFEHDSCGVGFVAHIKGKKSHEIVKNALTMLEHMDHRGACGCEQNTGDGAGILTALPHEFLVKVAMRDAGISLPQPGEYGAGIVFLPTDNEQRVVCEQALARIIAEQGQILLGWRDVPVDNSTIGLSARRIEPVMKMLFVGAGPGTPAATDPDALERQLYVIRKRATYACREMDMTQAGYFYICSLSTKVLIYKGQLTPAQVNEYFRADMSDPQFTSHLALVHSRFSTNTFPSWDRAHPFRLMAHNGEINTRRGNQNWMRVKPREMVSSNPTFSPASQIESIKPVIEPDGSDSAEFDNCLEMLLHTGRSLPQAVMMMIPEAWQNHESMDPRRRAFYEYHSCLRGALGWARLQFASLPSRSNTSRPKYLGSPMVFAHQRYYVTKDDLVIMASEVGVLPVPPENIARKGRLHDSGRMFLVDCNEGRIVDDAEAEEEPLRGQHPYGQWVQEQAHHPGRSADAHLHRGRRQ